jgi:hypothetical protein
MNNNILINNLRQKNNKQNTNTNINTNINANTNTNTNAKYNPDIDLKYDSLLSVRDKRDYEFSTTMWKPIIGSVDKTNITSDDLHIDIKKPDLNSIKLIYEKELADRKIEQNNLLMIRDDQKVKTNIIDDNKTNIIDDKKTNIIDKNFDDLKELSKNKNNIPNIDTISKLDDLLNSIKNM